MIHIICLIQLWLTAQTKGNWIQHLNFPMKNNMAKRFDDPQGCLKTLKPSIIHKVEHN